jgi:peptidyl-prolyl cis-trans isomerase D
MISWIQKYFQQHFRAVFAILLVLTIVSFVFTIGASPGIGHGERRVIEKPFFGLNLASNEDQQRLMGDAGLSAYLMTGGQGLDNDQLQQYALHRYATLHLANELRIPQPTPTELSDYLKGLRIFAGQNGEFDPAAYSRFRDNLKANTRISEGTVTRVLGDEWRSERIQKLFSGPGYITEADIRKQLNRADTVWSIATATLSYDSYKPSITPSEDDLAKYFADNAFRYEIQPRFSGSFVSFPASAYLAKVTVTEDEVRSYYTANKDRFRPASAKDDKKDESLAFAEVRSQVEAALRVDRARKLALKTASDLTVALFEKQAKPADLPGLISDAGLKLEPLTPFARDEVSPELGNSPEVVSEAFKLDADRFFSDAVSTPSGAAIIVYKETIPARQPVLAEVRAKVLVDYLQNERRRRFTELGRNLKTSVEARLKAGEAFTPAIEAACAAAGVSVEAKTVAPFSLRQMPRDLNYSLIGSLETLEKNQLSDMSFADNKGNFIYVSDKKLPAASESNPLYAQARTQLAQVSGGTTGAAILSELIANELKKGDTTEQK